MFGRTAVDPSAGIRRQPSGSPKRPLPAPATGSWATIPLVAAWELACPGCRAAAPYGAGYGRGERRRTRPLIVDNEEVHSHACSTQLLRSATLWANAPPAPVAGEWGSSGEDGAAPSRDPSAARITKKLATAGVAV